MIKTRPFLKWAGSKYRSIEILLNCLPSGSRLIEPFTGSGAVFLNSNYSTYLLAEKNGDLINLYQYIQQEGLPFIQYCKHLFKNENNCAVKYYQFRAEFNTTTDLRLKSALFLYLNRHGYNGLCRYNQCGWFNVPFGRYIKPYFPYLEMTHFHQKSQHAQFICEDFRQTFSIAKKGDVIYCDPPYAPLSASANFTAYTNTKFNAEDQIELVYLAKASAARGIAVVISNHDTAVTRCYYGDNRVISFPVLRNINCIANKRQAVNELVAVFT